ncbi:XRE family transcriptional regulator [Achromobacter insolitus]|uniref:XRE family transcriptional regulator n=1 Tax=Achromobacter insolitus TaxID=217204 RepID=UPI0020A25BCD|nr:LexA family transcriptional regulator [Achromobacter insolitus]MCP1404278.1 phage repressor protein C with HTH and peptisase S24 domain/transcriptional regulator with XRE-family HTH domain [Achromobacter insolitus]
MSKPTLNEILATNLARLMEKTGHKQASLAAASGVGQTTISLYLNPGRRQPSKSGKVPSAKFGEVEALADALGVMPWDLLRPDDDEQVVVQAPRRPISPRAGRLVDMDHADDPFPMRIGGLPPAPWEGGKTTHQAERERTLRISTQTGVVANVGVGEPPAANDKFEKVPELADVRLAAGEPIENHAEEQTGMIQFRKSFLKSVGADNGKARVVYAKGNSMEPIIRDGAALLVVPNESLTLRDLAAGGVYAINYDGKMIVKTVTRDRLTKQWVARSFNPTCPDIPLENGTPVRVLGQVVWAGARLRDDEAGQWVRS